jgi:hypothetical protein
MRPPVVAALVGAALALLAVGVVVGMAVGGDNGEAGAPATVTVGETTTETRTETVTETAAAETADGLPADAAATRAALLEAAEEGDHDRVAALAGDAFSYTFGGPVEGGPAAYWRQLEQETGERPLEILAALLRLPYTLHEGTYTWPFAFDTPLDELSEYERGLLGEVVDVGEAYAGGVGYAGWRTGIAPDGQWRFFVTGD